MRRLKHFTALTILLTCFIGCERESLEINHGDNIVSKQEAQSFLKNHPTDFYKASVDSLFYRQLPNAKGDKITYAVLEATTSHYKEYTHESKLALFKDKKGVVRGFVVGIYPANSPELQAKKGYSGAIFYETIDGKLLKERYYVCNKYFKNDWFSARAFIDKVLKKEGDLSEVEYSLPTDLGRIVIPVLIRYKRKRRNRGRRYPRYYHSFHWYTPMPLESIFDMLGGHSNKPDAWDADQRWKRRGGSNSGKPKKPKKKPFKVINRLTGKAKCVYGRLKSQNVINEILKNFEDNIKKSEFNLIFKMSNSLDNNTNASTKKSGKNFIIEINLKTLRYRTTLGLARTILHEAIHARLMEFASRGGSNSKKFPGVYDYYRRYGKNWQHQQMAAHYIDTIAKGLRLYDQSRHSMQYYEDLAWEGLGGKIKNKESFGENTIITKAWSHLSPNERLRIKNNISREKLNGNKNCL